MPIADLGGEYRAEPLQQGLNNHVTNIGAPLLHLHPMA